jgi:catechol 2,3-dioxygenase-like lactoylglutathione lyase family enzyme
MTVKRIVANIAAEKLDEADRFYGELLGLQKLMDHGWFVTFGTNETMRVQVGLGTEGGSGTPVPDISIEVDNVDEMHARTVEFGYVIEYGPADEPWGVRRFFVRDPFGKLVNVLTHL